MALARKALMLRSFLIGLVAGQRGVTPLAVTAAGARQGTLPAPAPLQPIIAHPVVAAGTVTLAAAEMAGDKMKTAPDRTVVLGLLARTITSGFAGAALAPPRRQAAGAALAVGAAVAASFAGLAARRWAMDRWGQTATGFVEDALVLGAAERIVTA